MTERVLYPEEREYKNMVAAAKIMEAVSKRGATYKVENVWLDFGQQWAWTTICGRGCQVLSPRQWKEIVSATTVSELAKAVQDVVSDKYFND